MTNARPFRFGIQASTAGADGDWAGLARKAEDLGFSSLFLPDHFGDQLAPVPAMMAAADATTSLRVGALVFDNDYKHPVVLAKEMATIDVLSGGRVEFGIGAGWMNTDYEQSGIPKERDGVRIAKMVEAIEIYRGLWSDGPFSFEGTHYSINGLDGLPKPVQKPHPPILIGGGGPKVLKIAAEHADIIGINPRLTAGEINAEAGRDAIGARVDEKVQWVKDAAGDRFDDIELNVLVFFGMIVDDRKAFAEQLAGGFGISPEDALELPYAWFGSVEEIADQLRAARDRWGISYFVLQKDAMDAMAPVVALLSGT
jgi:probable F420-dependent oxidoreductase